MTATTVRIRILGAFDARDQTDTIIEGLHAQPKRAAVLAYLAVSAPGGFVRRDKLLALFWPESTESHARPALNQAVHFLRGVVGPELVISQGADAIGVSAERVWCDATAFDEALSRGDREAALRLYRGAFFEGFILDGLLEFDQWVDVERRRRSSQAANAAWELADAALATGDPVAAVTWGCRAAELASDEASTRRMIALLDRTGDRAAALRDYDQFARSLRAEYDADPAPETQALIAAIRARDTATPGTVPPPPPIAVRSAPAAPVAPPANRASRLSRAGIRAALGVVVVALAALAVTQSRRRSSLTGAPVAMAQTVAVFPFAFRGGRDLGYLGDGVASLLTSNLATGSLRAVDARALGTAVARESREEMTVTDAAAVSEEFDAGLFVVGDITESGGRLRIDATLYDRTGGGNEVRGRAEGSSSDLFELVDDLTQQLMRGREGPALDRFRSAALTTHSIDALRSYLTGENAMRTGQYASAVEAFRRAGALDSTFALAFYGLSTAAHWTGEGQLAEWAVSRALASDDRLAARDRLRIAAWEAHLHGHAAVAESLFTRVVADNPTDVEALYHLADLHFHWGGTFGRPLVETKPEWVRVLDLDQKHAGALLHAARVAAAAKDRLWFDSLAQRLEALGPDAARSTEVRALSAFAFGDRAARVRSGAEIRLIPEATRRGIVQIVAATSRELEDVAELLGPTLFFDHTFMSFEDGQMLVIGQIELARGHLAAFRAKLDSVMLLRPRRAREFRALAATLVTPPSSAAQRAFSLAEMDIPLAPADLPRYGEPQRLYLRGMLQVRQGDTVSARRAIAALQAFRSGEADAVHYARRYALVIAAEILRSAGRPAEALAALGSPRALPSNRLPYVWSYPLAHERFLRAELLEATGRMDEALRWYATFPDPNAYDFMFLPGAVLRRAQLLERMGRTAEAGDDYDRFLRLWETADPSLQPFVASTRTHRSTLRPR